MPTGEIYLEAFFAAAVAARFVKRAKNKTSKKLPSMTAGDEINTILTGNDEERLY